jgi:hypothetical protein
VLCSLLWERYKLTVIQPALLRYYGNAIKLIVTQHTQQELLRYYGDVICHSMNDIKNVVLYVTAESWIVLAKLYQATSFLPTDEILVGYTWWFHIAV